MLKQSDLDNLLNTKGRSNHDRTLLCLALEPLKPRNNKEICEIARKHGWASVSPGTVSTALSRAKGLAILSGVDGWKLTDEGVEHVTAIAESRLSFKPPAIAASLRAHLPKIADVDTRAFVEEAVKCFEFGLHRAAIVMSWIGAVHLLYGFVLKNRLADFNAEATKRRASTKYPWKPAQTVDDLSLMNEGEFLDVLQSISVLGKTVKNALKICLDRRNGCGHPNTYKIAENVVAAHVEELMLNVYEKF